MSSEHKSRVLIVDDEPDLREIIAFDFEAAGYTVDCAEDGFTAWKALSEAKYDAVVSDVRMPNSDGISLLKKVKESGKSEEPVMVFVTGFTDLTVDEAFHLGIDGFFEKPFDRRELVRNIQRLLTPPLERWKKPIKKEKIFSVQMTFSTIEDAKKNSEFNLGRGGIFLACQKFTQPVGSRVNLDLDFDGSKIIGTGLVRWIRLKTSEDLKSGVGIEFESLDEPSLSLIGKLLKANSQMNNKAFIPRG